MLSINKTFWTSAALALAVVLTFGAVSPTRQGVGGGSGGSGGSGTNAMGTLSLDFADAVSVAMPNTGVWTNLAGFSVFSGEPGVGANASQGTMYLTNQGRYLFLASIGGTTPSANQTFQFTFFTNKMSTGFGDYSSNNTFMVQPEKFAVGGDLDSATISGSAWMPALSTVRIGLRNLDGTAAFQASNVVFTATLMSGDGGPGGSTNLITLASGSITVGDLLATNSVIGLGTGATAGSVTLRDADGSAQSVITVLDDAPTSFTNVLSFGPVVNPSDVISIHSTNNGVLVLTNTPAGSGTPAGSSTEVQYRNAGAFGGDAKFTWNSTLNTLTVNNTFDSTALALVGTADTLQLGPSGIAMSNSTTMTFFMGITPVWTLTSAGNWEPSTGSFYKIGSPTLRVKTNWVDTIDANDLVVRNGTQHAFVTQAGVGGGNTNFLIDVTGSDRVFINGGAANVHLIGTNMVPTMIDKGVLYITNRTATPRELSFGHTATAYWKPVPIGTDGPYTITNATGLMLSYEVVGTNIYYAKQAIENP